MEEPVCGSVLRISEWSFRDCRREDDATGRKKDGAEGSCRSSNRDAREERRAREADRGARRAWRVAKPLSRPRERAKECRASLTSVNYARGRGLSTLVWLLPLSLFLSLFALAPFSCRPKQTNILGCLSKKKKKKKKERKKGEAFRPRHDDRRRGTPESPWPRHRGRSSRGLFAARLGDRES